jgi:ferric-dicitrate binding protein FerR (iron transport regulator)
LLTELFGREENSVQITPPQLPAIDINALGTVASRSTRREMVAPAAGSRLPRPNGRQIAVIAGAALLGAAAFSLGTLWQRQSTNQPADRGERNPVVMAGSSAPLTK